MSTRFRPSTRHCSKPTRFRRCARHCTKHTRLWCPARHSTKPTRFRRSAMLHRARSAKVEAYQVRAVSKVCSGIADSVQPLAAWSHAGLSRLPFMWSHASGTGNGRFERNEMGSVPQVRQGTPTCGARSWPIPGLPFLQFLWAPASGIDEEAVEGSPSNGVE